MRDLSARLRRLPPPRLHSAIAAIRTPRGRRTLLIDRFGGVALVGAALIVPAAIVATPSANSASLVASPSSVAPGSAITVDGTGFGRRATGAIVLDAGTTQVRFVANGRGTFSVSLPVPTGEPGGQHPVSATNPNGSAIAWTTVFVLGPLAGVASPTAGLTARPTDLVGLGPSLGPTPFATFVPTLSPSLGPTPFATFIPTLSPTPAGTLSPTLAPTVPPTLAPTSSPTLAPTVRPTLAPTPAPTPIAYTFDDEFNGSSLAAVWGTAGHWSGLSEASISRSHTTVANGVMTITATRTSPNVWVSDTVDTFGRFSQTYGYFEARIRFTSGRGLWPAFWLAHDWTGDKSELDINETLANPYVAGNCDTSAGYYATVHLADGSTPAGSRCRLGATDLAGGWHTYAMDWRADHITFYLDGVAWSTYTGPIPTATMPIIFNLAVGGWAGASDSTTPSPSIMQVDWVRARA